jgi:insulysin
VSLARAAEKTLGIAPLTPKELLSPRALIVPEGRYITKATVENAENVNSAIEQFTYVGDITNDRERALASVFSTMVSDPLFDQLRTKEQLGYIVRKQPHLLNQCT